LAEPDTEAKQARELTGKVAELEKELIEKNSTLALAGQQAENDREGINDLRKRLGEARVDAAELRTKIVAVQQDLKAEHQSEIESIKEGYRSSITDLKASHEATVIDLKEQIANESRRLDNNRQDYKDEIAGKKQELFDFMEGHRKSNLQIQEENRGLAESVKVLEEDLHTERLSFAEEKGRLVGELSTLKEQLGNQRTNKERIPPGDPSGSPGGSKAKYR